MGRDKAALLWFRKGLRLHDNPALLEALDGAVRLYPVFVLDPYFLKPERVGTNRLQFLLESLQDLDSSLRARGSQLLVLRGNPVDLLPVLFKEWSITQLCFEADTEPYAKQRDAQVRALAEAAVVQVHCPVSHTLYDTGELVQRNGGKPPLTYKAFEKLIASVGLPAPPAADPPASLPPVPSQAAGGRPTHVPSLKDLGYQDEPTTVFKGGETRALARMADQLADKNWVVQFEKPKGDPAAFLKPATTVLSPYLKFGCISPRLFFAQLHAIEAEKPKHTLPPVSLRGQLMWREFFYTVGAHTPNFDRMEGNPICRQIPWDDNEEFYNAWENARTGYPWIDAIMMQLRTQGWMHHLARHSVACFLTRGNLYVSWEKGRDTFDRLLIDGDWSINNGNWMWLSASAFFSQYFRVYSPITFGKKYDPEGHYIRHFLPVLKEFPAKYIYEPWTAPLSVQKAVDCIIGTNYPRPIVEHATIHKANIARMKQAYDSGAGSPSHPSPQRANEPASAPATSAGQKRRRSS
ncbi:hypothetical protein WJX72_001282 [[Myrmecia] bisecta]|uniref:Photolyase/cryptochrome alpha/beta domain-containing protein n=1 Tax=[Myrmecia] bisecta TaxID=41462 RepID=A0AAW1P8U2_9CHLO